VLMRCDHENIVKLKEIVVGKDVHNSFYMVMEYLAHDLKDLMTAMRDPFLSSEIKCLMLQLLEAIDYLHSNWFIHRDLKTSNLLLSTKGILKVADFGLARHFGMPLRPYTQPVVTLWYRAPELLLGATEYSWAVDMWAVGCIFAEMLTKDAPFKGRSEIDQIDVIFKSMGTPDETAWPGFSELPYPKKMKFRKYPPRIRQTISSATTEAGFELLMRMLAYDPAQRITAREAINHQYFKEHPLPREPGLIQTFPSLHEGKKHPKVTRNDVFTVPDALATNEEAEKLGVDPYGIQPSTFKLKF